MKTVDYVKLIFLHVFLESKAHKLHSFTFDFQRTAERYCTVFNLS